MQIRTYFKHMDVSESLEQYATAKVAEQIEKFCKPNSWAQLSFSIESGVSTVRIEVYPGFDRNLNVHAEDSDIYAAVDKVVDKLTATLHRLKDRTTSHRERSSIRFVALTASPEQDEMDLVEDMSEQQL